MTEIKRIDVGYAALAVDSGDVPTESSTLVSGVAIGEGDITIGGSGKQTFWPKETLKEAAESLEGQPLATDTDHTAEDPQPQTPVEAIAGEVVNAGYVDGVGVVFEAELDDESLAEKVRNGRLEVSPLLSRDIEPLEDGEAAFKATDINRWRDLALVANGAAPSNEITVGESPVTAEALHEALQEPALDTSVDVPERVQNAAQAALDADEDGLIPDSCGTGTGTSRAEALADNDVEVNDFLTRGEDDKTPIPAYLNSHEGDASTEQPPTNWGEEEWSDCGNVGMARWGWYVDWFREKANELSRQRGEEEPYESMASASTAGEAEALQRESAREPTFDGTETSEEQPWGDVSKDLTDWVAALGFEAESTADLTADQKQTIAEHTLLGDAEADSWNELSYFPVVNPNNGNLNEGALNAVRGGRGAQADIPADTYDDAEETAASLLANEFGGYEMDNGELMTTNAESMADVEDVDEGTLVKWGSSGERPAFGMVEEIRTEGDEPLDDEIDGDVTIDPPAALITVHRPMDGEFEETEQQVGHTLNTDTLTVIDELPNPESLAEYMDESMEDVPEAMQFDNPGEAMSEAQSMGFEEIHTHGEGEDTVFMPGPTHSALIEELDMNTQNDDGAEESMSQSSAALAVDSTTMDEDTINAVVAAAEELDDPVSTVESLAAADDPTVVESETYESMRGVLEEALSEKAALKESTIEALSFNALVGEFKNEDGELVAEALVQHPETGQPEESEAEALSEDADKQKAEALYQDYQRFENDRLKDDIVEALGVSDFETAAEVLD
jgi:hypothetical protein